MIRTSFPLVETQWNFKSFQQARNMVSSDTTGQLLDIEELSDLRIVKSMAGKDNAKIFTRVCGEQRKCTAKLT